MAATGSSVGEVIDNTLDLLLGASRESLNMVYNPIGVTDTTISITYNPTTIQPNTYIEIDEELMYVWASEFGSPSSTVTVQRGMRSTVATTHEAGALIRVDPYFPKYQVQKALQAEIGSWGPQVYAVATIDIPLTDYVGGYDLGILGDYYRIMDVRESPDLELGYVSDNMWPRVKWEELKNAPFSQFPSGNALFIIDPLGVWDSPQNSPRTVHVIYAKPFDWARPWSLTTDLISDVGIDANELDIPPYGAAWRLLQGREARRTLVEAWGQSADLKEEPPMYASQAAQAFKAIRDGRLADAMQRLNVKFGVRGK